MTYEQRNCREFLNRNSSRFGITAPNISGEYLEICARSVRCVASRTIDEKLILPSMSSFINSCGTVKDCAPTHKNNCDCECDDGCECASVCK